MKVFVSLHVGKIKFAEVVKDILSYNMTRVGQGWMAGAEALILGFGFCASTGRSAFVQVWLNGES